MNILLLGAAGQVSRYLHENLLNETDHNIILFARNAFDRIEVRDPRRETLIEGDFANKEDLNKAMQVQDIDLVYLDEAVRPEHVQNIVLTMKDNNLDRLIVASALGIYNELPEKFEEWNNEQIGSVLPGLKESADIIERSSLKYTIMRMAWLYDEDGNENYELTDKEETFRGTQVARQAIARFVMDMLEDLERYENRSVGISQPNTQGYKPLFMDAY